ncbi:dephospho-CoA kinase [Nitrosospira multiformis]|uniref:dephospho-CoA kinase n=1 Tax=Nitrosospira multiformis TaxID=1231 RepID=UPI000899A654|nr:dephospho-CoA kinase [Nitrosospira multiformis]SEA52474.1 dephospho-CoA kinase [Nitrosospira multiformis]
MLVIGLTGGIGSGKTSAANIFSALGAGVVDTDEIAHELTQSGGRSLPAIRRAFGEKYITPEGALNRKEMRNLVFNDTDARRKLEAILHPLIRDEVSRRVGLAQAPYLIIVVPLLLETGHYRGIVQRVLVVDCSEGAQISRATARSGMNEQAVRAIMVVQVSRDERLGQADDVIVNDADLTNLERQVRALHKKYMTLAQGS